MIATLAALVYLTHVQGQLPVVWTGDDSKVTKAEISLLTTQWAWMRTWMRHTGQAKALAEWEKYVKGGNEAKYDHYNRIKIPEVNFKSHSMVVMFGGTTSQTAGYTVMDAIADGSTLTIRYVPRYYSTFISKPEDRKMFIDMPFAFIPVSKAFSTIRLEEGIIEQKGEPPTKFKLIKELRG